MPHRHFSTLGLSAEQSQRAWHNCISQALFELDIQSLKPRQTHFVATLENQTIHHLNLIRLRADAACYSRQVEHINCSQQADFCLFLNNRHPATFHQAGRDTVCHTGNFLLQFSQQTFQFNTVLPLDAYIVKIPKTTLKEYLPQPERYCALEFNGHSGIGLLFRRHLINTAAMLHHINAKDAALIEKQLLELLAHAIGQDDRVLQTADSTIRAAHLLRIEQYATAHLTRNDLTCEQVAAACGISVRYLHLIFKDTGSTFSDWLRTRRLQTARRQLQSPHFDNTLAQLAHSLGFTDQSHFSKAYRRHFGESPRDTLIQHSPKRN